MKIDFAATDEQIAACFPAIRELRPLLEAGHFVATIRDLERDGYRLAFLAVDESSSA